jgi:hypothetical protein
MLNTGTTLSCLWPKVAYFCIIAIAFKHSYMKFIWTKILWGRVSTHKMRVKNTKFSKKKKIKKTDLGKGRRVKHEFYDLELPILRGPCGQGVHVPDQLVLKNINQFLHNV